MQHILRPRSAELADARRLPGSLAWDCAVDTAEGLAAIVELSRRIDNGQSPLTADSMPRHTAV